MAMFWRTTSAYDDILPEVAEVIRDVARPW